MSESQYQNSKSDDLKAVKRKVIITCAVRIVICGRPRLARVLLSVCASRSGAVICSAFGAALVAAGPDGADRVPITGESWLL
jgi:hypothetical protein